ncbi:MarR family winged helix-turn-helix transcriptional regulator [Actinoplanes sp. NPDC051494]|uniref:MarR family winged helix-turn-helix transcriptional regulator n=1 Tax=Actinoplanes sp. NPDC051494 TaxID=3363907 RepID=UPI00378E59AB
MAEEQWLDDSQQQTWRTYLTMVRELDRHLQQHLQRASGMSVTEFELLARLSEAPGHRLPVATLAEVTGWEPSRLSHQLSRTGKRGLIDRVASDKARYPDAVLTEDGLAVITRAAPQHAAAVHALFIEPLGPDGLGALATIARTVLNGLEAHQSHACSLHPHEE